MSNFSALIATIQANIKTNGQEEITGAILQDVLEAMVQALGTEAINNLETSVSTLSGTVSGIEGKIPSAATSNNKLTDKAYVDAADTTLTNAINAINDAIENGYVYAGIATPSGTPASGKVFYIATAAGTYTNFLDSGSSALVVTQGINILKFNGTAWSQDQIWAVDDIPTAGSNNLVKSGGVARVLNISKNISLQLQDIDDRCFDTKAWSKNGVNITLSQAVAAWSASDYIELPDDAIANGFSITNVRCYTGNGNHIGYFFDENLGYLGIIGTGSEGATTFASVTIASSDIPSGAKYIVFNGNGNADSSFCSFSALKKLISKNNNEISIEKQLLSSVINQLQDSDDCSFDAKVWAYNSGNPILYNANSAWKASDYIRLSDDAIANGFSITNIRSFPSNGTHSGYYFDENLRCIGIIGNTSGAEQIIPLLQVPSSGIPSGAKYIIFNGNGSQERSLCSFSKLKALLPPSVDSVDKLYKLPQNPLEVIKREAGFASLFLNWGFIGDSLASGEYNCKLNGVSVSHDFYDFSWGQFICRMTGSQGYNFSKGGETAHDWINGASDREWGGAQNNPKTSYIIALGTNDITIISSSYPVGTSADVNLSDYTQNANSFFGDYAGVIQRLRSIQPNVPIFCCTTLNGWGSGYDDINNAIRSCVSLFSHVYLIDMYQYFPSVAGSWFSRYGNVAHFTAQGYLEMAWGIMNYIDFIVRNNWQAFKNQGLIGTDYTL